MPKNIGTIDKVIRIILALTIGVLWFTKQISGTAGIILGIIAIIFVLTSLIGTCPIYLPFGISTQKKG